LPAAFPYLRPEDFFLELDFFFVAIISSLISEKHGRKKELRSGKRSDNHDRSEIFVIAIF
jgi:hypothetical protein